MEFSWFGWKRSSGDLGAVGGASRRRWFTYSPSKPPVCVNRRTRLGPAWARLSFWATQAAWLAYSRTEATTVAAVYDRRIDAVSSRRSVGGHRPPLQNTVSNPGLAQCHTTQETEMRPPCLPFRETPPVAGRPGHSANLDPGRRRRREGR